MSVLYKELKLEEVESFHTLDERGKVVSREREEKRDEDVDFFLQL